MADPLPSLQQRLKPWVRWSIRERRIGLGLHLEQEREALSAHIDLLNPGSCLLMFVPHIVVDSWGWATLRPRLLSLLSGADVM